MMEATALYGDGTQAHPYQPEQYNADPGLLVQARFFYVDQTDRGGNFLGRKLYMVWSADGKLMGEYDPASDTVAVWDSIGFQGWKDRAILLRENGYGAGVVADFAAAQGQWWQKTIAPAFELSTLASIALVAPLETAIFAGVTQNFNEDHGIETGPINLDVRPSDTFKNAVLPTVETVGAAAATYYGGPLGLMGATYFSHWAENQLGVVKGTTGYAQYGETIGGIVGGLGSLYDKVGGVDSLASAEEFAKGALPLVAPLAKSLAPSVKKPATRTNPQGMEYSTNVPSGPSKVVLWGSAALLLLALAKKRP